MSTAPAPVAPSDLPSEWAPLCLELAVVGAKAVRMGLVLGSGGNLSARLPGSDACVVTASGAWLDELTVASFSLVRIGDGALLAGHPTPSSEVMLHLASYRVRDDAHALVHLHPQMSVLLDALGHRVRLITLDHAYYVREVRSTPYLPSGTQEVADAGAAAVADGCNCVILGNHGCSVLGPTVEAAAKSAFNLEEAATATFRALQLGDTTTQAPDAYFERIGSLPPGRH